MRAVNVLLCVLAVSSLPVDSFAQGGRIAARRAEARVEVGRLLTGGQPQTALSRLQYLGEQRYAAQELIPAFPRLTAEDRRRNVAQVIAGLGVAFAEPFLAELTRDPDGVLRMYGATGLGRLRSKQVQVLLPLLDDPSWAVRREAARALGQSKMKKAVKPLLAAAKTEGELEVRQAMLISVGQLGDKKAKPALVPYLESSSESTRFAAARALVLLGAPQGFDFAGKLLGSEDRFVRRQGVTLFEGVPAKQAKKHLEPMLNDPDKRLAAMAARTLYQGGDKARLDWLVLASWVAPSEEKLHYEAELETLMVTDAQRRAILQKAGVP